MVKAFLFLLVFNTLLASPTAWLTDFEKAKEVARESRHPILLNFSGSDWCVPCIHLTKTVFEDTAFREYAAKELVLLRADFPRLKKNQPDKEQVRRNEALAEKYNPSGAFPLTLLLDADGKVLMQWEGDPKMNAAAFVEQVKSALQP
jgi:thioredoxin-related protein